MLATYRVSHPNMHRGFSDKFWGVPPACGPLLQLATAQAGQGNSQNKTRRNLTKYGMGNSEIPGHGRTGPLLGNGRNNWSFCQSVYGQSTCVRPHMRPRTSLELPPHSPRLFAVHYYYWIRVGHTRWPILHAESNPSTIIEWERIDRSITPPPSPPLFAFYAK